MKENVQQTASHLHSDSVRTLSTGRPTFLESVADGVPGVAGGGLGEFVAVVEGVQGVLGERLHSPHSPEVLHEPRPCKQELNLRQHSQSAVYIQRNSIQTDTVHFMIILPSQDSNSEASGLH